MKQEQTKAGNLIVDSGQQQFQSLPNTFYFPIIYHKSKKKINIEKMKCQISRMRSPLALAFGYIETSRSNSGSMTLFSLPVIFLGKQTETTNSKT